MARPRKMGYGEGSVYFDKSKGVWRGALTTVDGTRRRVSGATRSEAVAALDELRGRRANEMPTDDTALGEWVAWWLENVGAPNEDSGDATRANYSWALGQTAAIGGVQLRSLTTAQVNRLLGQLANRKPSKPGARGGRRGPLGRSALTRVRFALRVVLDDAMANELVTKNVAKLARLPRAATETRPRRSLTVQQAKDLMKAAKGHRLEAMVGTMLYCGLRPGEATGLTWDHTDVKNKTLVVGQSRKVAPDGTMTIGDTKAKSDRAIVIVDRKDAPLLKLLTAHSVRQKKERMAAPVWEHEDLVFTNAIGDYIDPSNLRREIAGLCEDAGIFPAISPNELRHTAASLLRASGATPDQIANFLGHKDNRMVHKHYFDSSVMPVIDLTETQGRMLTL
jgi:integrase